MGRPPLLVALLTVTVLSGILTCQPPPQTARIDANAGRPSSRGVPTGSPPAPSAGSFAAPPRSSSSPRRVPTTTSINISTPAAQYALGASIELRVAYRNVGSHPLELREPQKTWELLLRVACQNDERSAPFGRLLHTNYGGIERIVIEEAEVVTLVPGATHSFTEDIGERWPSLFEPGRCIVSVRDRNLELDSNEVPLEIALTKASIAELLDVLAQSPSPPDPHRSSSEESMAIQNRQFAAVWICQLYPALDVEVPPPDQATETRNQASVQAARDFWQHNQDQPAVLKKIAEFNRVGSDAAPRKPFHE